MLLSLMGGLILRGIGMQLRVVRIFPIDNN
jgi:hypothetical protein